VAELSYNRNNAVKLDPIRGIMIDMRVITLSTMTFRKVKQGFALLMVYAFWIAGAWAAQVVVSVDRNPVSIDDSFQIVFSADETPDDDPDFSPLEQDFDIISQSNSSSAAWINGKASKSIQWTLTVMAKQAGSLVIPPVKFGKDASQALSIMVTQGAVSNNLNTGEDIILEVEAAPENPYVQSQILYTVRVFTRVEIARASLNEPELADAVIEKLVEDSNYTTQINGVDYSVTERKYAIFPQKSGIITINPLVLTADVLTNSRPSFNGFFSPQLTKTKRVSSKAITMEVKPAPASFTAPHWLSAEQLVLKESWSGDIRQMEVGEPLTRTLTLQAKGATVGQLPELNTIKSNDQIKVYPDQPVLQEQKKPEGLTALREEKIALIPSKAGSYTLPAIEVPWFNTQTQATETARIPETTVTAAVESGAEDKIQAPAISTANPKINQPALIIQAENGNVWQWLSLFLAAGWLATLVFFLTRRPAAIKPVLNHKEEDIDLGESIKNLKKACTDNDAQAAKNALIQWGRKKLNVSSLGAIASCCDARLRDEILYLSSKLYGKEPEQWQGKKLFQAFAENKARKTLVDKENSGLQPLYRL
jgi:hypothetical protein